MSQVWNACSLRRRPRHSSKSRRERAPSGRRRRPARSAGSPPRGPRAGPRRRPGRRRPWPGPPWRSTRPTPTARSRRASRRRPGASSRRRRMMTAPEPRCDSTSAIDHSAGVGLGLELGVVEAAAELVQAADRGAERGRVGCPCRLRSTRRRPAPSRAPASTSPGRRPAWPAADRAARSCAVSSGSSEPESGPHHVGQHVDGVAQRRHLELHRHLAQLLHGPGAAGVAPADERHGLAPPLHERRVEGVLQHGRVAVVVLAGEDDVAVGAVDHPAEPDHGLVGVVAAGPGGRVAVEEGERVVAQVDQLDLERVVLGQPARHPGRHPLAEATLPGRARDHLQQHDLRLPSLVGVLPAGTDG